MRLSSLNYGKDFQYASTRLRSSVVLYGKEPVLLGDIDGKGYVFVEYLVTGMVDRVPLDNLNLTPVELGYVNDIGNRDKAVYCFRDPARLYKQGLTKENFRRNDKMRSSFKCATVGRTIKNIFPKISSCIEYLLNDELDKIAFSRDFALEKYKEDILLIYRDTIVGVVLWNSIANNINYKLNIGYEFLQEVLEEAIKNV